MRVRRTLSAPLLLSILAVTSASSPHTHKNATATKSPQTKASSPSPKAVLAAAGDAAAKKLATEKAFNHASAKEEHVAKAVAKAEAKQLAKATSALPPPPPDVPPEKSFFGAGISIACALLLLLGAAGMFWRDIADMSASLSNWGLQIGSFFVLVAVQSTALLLFRLCQTSGAYEFSPASCVALTEACKLVLASTLHLRHVRSTGDALFHNVTPKIVAHYFGLALCYTVNNQLTFYCLQMVDPGTFGLGKSLAPYLVAMMLRFLGTKLNELQWVCIVLQCICIAITQYNACKAAAIASGAAYAMIGIAVSITAVSSVWNQKVVKGFDVPVNLQNALLYVFGLLIAILSYVAIPDAEHPNGFFYGYSLLAIFLVVFQAFHGLAVTLVYKYADAIVKNFANSAVMAILVLVSAYAFGATTNLTSYLGVAGVLVTTYAYMNIALKM